MRRGISLFSILVLAVAAGCASQPKTTGAADAAGAEPSAGSTAQGEEQLASLETLREIDQKTCPAEADSYQDWVNRFRSFALNQGRPEPVVETAFLGLKENPEIAERASKQPEFVTPVWTYLERAVSPERVARGKEMYVLNRAVLSSVSEKYGVGDAILMGIWGIETDFGNNFGDISVFEALTNLGYAGGRSSFACAELLAAIDIVAEDRVAPERMVGSWAGAMGHPQFLPSNYLKLAVDEDGSGAPDLWNSMPDAFASTANHLKKDGWVAGLPWGMEVTLPVDFPFQEAEIDQKSPIAHWRNLGVTRIGGGALPTLAGDSAILLLAGWQGPAFLVTSNFNAILKYNFSTSYALSVGILGDRVMGGPGVAGTWPVAEQPLSLEEREEVQTLLTEQGFDPGPVDGVLGLNTRKAARGFQASVGLKPDGFITKALLQALREKSTS